ncbi:hypothetical protein CBR_g4275 [Chara braunii]|uniref:Uncharacterized protein n=1 Tax=Chara braunii TaxID=69332 RepID=A0A388JR66_CHABU|nr:hypothetical protein CBR_g4275 [Chara braunii]|eukprot:GBG60319.1 hypothetical protein CBR_g4275 [Chara braunii]
MESVLDGLSDVSTFLCPTLAIVAPPTTGRVDDTDGVSRGFDEFAGDTILHPTVFATLAIFHVGAPHAVDQGLAEQVARNRHGGPRIVAQRSLRDSFERVDVEYVAQDGHRARDFVGDGDHEHRASSDAQRGADGPISRAVGGWHTGDARPHLMAMRSAPPHPHGVDPFGPAAQGLPASTALPTVSFYDGVTRDRRAGDEVHALPTVSFYVPAGTRSIGLDYGGCHDSMRAYEERHGRPTRAKTSNVHGTRTAIVRLSQARKKGTSTSIPYHRRLHLPSFHARDPTRMTTVGAVADGGTGVGGSTTILHRSERGHDALHGGASGAAFKRDVVDCSGRVEKRRDDVVIYHDDSSTAEEAGKTTGADDLGDSNYVPRGRAADGNDDIGRRVRQRIGLGPHSQGTPRPLYRLLINMRKLSL